MGETNTAMATISLQKVFEIVRRNQGVLPEPLAAHLFCSAVARAVEAGIPLRPWMVVLEAGEGLRLTAAFAEDGHETHDLGYVAPEALDGEIAVDDPRVLVYAAGALGYELLTGNPPPGSHAAPRTRVPGALGEIVRIALSPRPFDRFGSLEEMRAALNAVHPPPPPDLERLLFAALFSVCARWLPGQRPPLQEHREGDAPRTTNVAALTAWTQKLDTLVEDLQRQQLELVAVLASQELVRTAPATPSVSEPAGSPRQREHLELLQRIAAMSGTSPAAAPVAQLQSGPPLWLVWGGAAAVSAAMAAVVSILISTGSAGEFARPPPVPARAAAEAPSVPPAQPPALPLAPSSQPQVLPVAPSSVAAADPVDSLGDDSSLPSADGRGDASPGARGHSAPRRSIGSAKPPVPKGSATVLALVGNGERELRRGKAAEAIEAFRAALAAQADAPGAIRGMAMAHMMQGKEKEAKEEFKKYLLLAPDADDAGRIRKVIENLDGDGPK